MKTQKIEMKLLEAIKEACRIMNGDLTRPLARILEARAVLVQATATGEVAP